MKIIGVETTCDETGIAALEIDKKERFRILANEIASQYKVHQPFGGVVPILAAREHKKNLPILWSKVENIAKNADFIAFSYGPGLAPALIQGKEFVLKLSKKLKIKIVPVNHLAGHFYSFLLKNKIKRWQKLKEIDFPCLGLIISGGHTILYLFSDYYHKKKLGETLDDALGEAFDKVARMLGLPYPGGPWIEKLAKSGKPLFSLPKPVLNQGYKFSFAGLKTAVLEIVEDLKTFGKLNEDNIKNLASSFQKTCFEIIIQKLDKAMKEYRAKSIVVGGGVAANRTLKNWLENYFGKKIVYFPEKILATDNGLNIALAGYFKIKKLGKRALVKNFDIHPRLPW
jgi:N6-L-threonylcarbamoyladenine synthase